MMPEHTHSEESLEPIMPFPECPRCGAPKVLDLHTYKYYNGAVTCYECKGKFEIRLGDTNRVMGGDGGTLLSPPRPVGDPEILEGLSVSAIPPELYLDFQDAAMCLAFGVPRGTAVLCRHAIQRALLLKDVPDRKPVDMINIARSKNLLSETAALQCSAAIFMGGKGAHPQVDELENIGENDARQALLMTRRVLLELFHPEGLRDV